MSSNPGAPSLACWHNLNETSGTREDDHATHDLTSYNSVGYESGKKGNAATFVRTSAQRLAVAPTAGLNLGSDTSMTIFGWVKLASKPADLMYLVSKYVSSVDGAFGLYWDNTVDRFIFAITDGAGHVGSVQADNFGAPTTATWYFFAAGYDATAQQVWIEVDNGTRNTTSYTYGTNEDDNSYTLGARGNLSKYLDGSLDEVGYYNGRSLVPSECQWFYNGGVGRIYTDLYLPDPEPPGTPGRDLFKIRWFNTAGVLQYETTDFLSLSYQRIVNGPGGAIIIYAGDHPLVDDLADKWTAQIWRCNQEIGLNWFLDFDCIFRSGRRVGTDPGLFYAYCPGQLHRLSWRHILYYAGTADRSEFTSEKAETVLKTLVTYNATSSASTANGRLRDGTMSEIAVESDGASGNTVDHYCSWEELLASLQRLAPLAGGDFDLVKTAATTYQFRWYTGQLGTDRSTTVIFATGLGNMGNPVYLVSHHQEKTVALAGGQGEGELRETAIRTGSDYHVTTNNIELFVDARNVKPGNTAGLQAMADQKLDTRRAEVDFAFDVLQTPACYYGLHYFLGDLVKVVNPFTGSTATMKINELSQIVPIQGDPILKVYMVDA